MSIERRLRRLVEEIVNEKVAEMYGRLEQLVRENFERFAEEYLNKSGVDERRIRSIAKAIAASEALRIVMAEMDRVRGEVEALARQGVDVEVIKRLVEDAYGKVLDDVKRILDQRIAHIISVIDEQGNEVRDALDLINEILRSEIEFGEKIEEVRRLLDEERLEELLYRVLVKRGLIRKRRRRWVLPIVGLSILIAIAIGLLINPILTVVVLFIVFVILMRW